MTDELQTTKVKSESGIRINDDKMDEVAEKISNKMSIPKAKAEAILKIGILEGLMMNRYRNIDLKRDEEK